MTADGRVDWLAGGGELGALLRDHDWANSPLGPPETWPQSLKTSVRIMLTSRQPIWVGWGPELIYLYNDPYKSIIGGKHPWALGRPTSEVWREIWDEIRPMLDTALGGVEGTYVEQQLLIMERNGYPEETYYTFSYSPIPDDEGRPAGIICANTEDTRQVIGERQLVLLRDLAAHAADARNGQEACERSAEALAANPRDIPFAMLYMCDDDRQNASLVASTGIEPGHPVAPTKVAVTGPDAWVLGDVLRTHEAQVVDTKAEVADILPLGAWDRPSQKFALLPVTPGGESGRAGVLVVGLNPYRLFDDAYHGFLGLVAGQIASAIANADAYEAETRRAQALADLDTAKTAFFSNVSHEFRTPLTLLLGPVEQILAKPADQVLPDNRALLELAHRNGLRLQKLVNTLLDFSRIEAGRARAHFEPTDLAAFTAELASNFRSATDRAGLTLEIDCQPLTEPVYVDRDMWEKVVLNLLSNAFKFTFEGGIRVVLRQAGGQVELRVEDTGVGVAAEELPRLFERFHRVAGSRGRSHEGTGIGLALVQELVRLHGGDIGVESAPGRGAAFTIHLPLGMAHLPADQIAKGSGGTTTPARAEAFLAEALRWLPGGDTAAPVDAGDDAGALPAVASGHRIVLADDNADMRGYIQRLLTERGYIVEAVADGEAALAAAKRHPPDLILSDVMMPRLDGFGLLAALRADSRTREAPVILLSARAGEEAKIEGLEAGADDYLTKPFSARELFARVDSAIALAEVRRQMSDLHRRQEKRQRFLLDLGDRLRGLADPAQQKTAAAQALGEHLGAGRVGYVDVDEDGETFIVGEDWTNGMPSASGTRVFGDFGPDVAAGFQAGVTLRADDVETAPGFADHRDAFAALAIRAFVAVPLIKNSRLSAILHVHEPKPRAWTDDDISLIEEVAERTWAAAEHSRAEARLQARNLDLERAFDDLSRSSRRQRLLIHELNHRVKNTLATVQSMAVQSLSGNVAPDDARQAFEARLMSLSVAHNILTQESWEGADLSKLAVQTLRPFSPAGERMTVDGPRVWLAPKAALALAMAMHELATNASKYGAFSDEAGRLSLRWSIEPTAAGESLRIVWREHDGPAVVPPERRGFGSRLIERGLAAELGGRAELTFAPTGLVALIAAPLDRLITDDEVMALEPALAETSRA